MITPDLIGLWQSMVITDPDRFAGPVAKAKASIGRYARVADRTNAPWQVIAALHIRECDGRWDQHLHNGDPLTARTVHVPKGYPLHGEPPFPWEDSAVDALSIEGLSSKMDWNLGITLARIERYNGFGYRKRDVLSPYLWAGTNHYIAGKFVEDYQYEADAIDRQPGCAGLIKLLGYQAPA